MKKVAVIIICAVAISACEPKSEVAIIPPPVQCYDIINTPDAPPPSPILINKCTGSTWMLLSIPLPKIAGEKNPDYRYRWYEIRVDNLNSENIVSGK